MSNFPTDPKRRKQLPIVRGLLDYFPHACLAVADVSRVGNDQHNPGQPMHWARGKSTDQEDTAVRHLLERGKFDTDGRRHMAKAAWRILASLQLEIEADGGAIALEDMPTHNFEPGTPVAAGEPFFTAQDHLPAFLRGPTVEETLASMPPCHKCGGLKATPEHICPPRSDASLDVV